MIYINDRQRLHPLVKVVPKAKKTTVTLCGCVRDNRLSYTLLSDHYYYGKDYVLYQKATSQR